MKRLAWVLLCLGSTTLFLYPAAGSSKRDGEGAGAGREEDGAPRQEQPEGREDRESADTAASAVSSDVYPAPFVLGVLDEVAETTVTPRGSLSGRILDHTGRPVEGAVVICRNQEGRVTAETRSDRDGRYRFDGLPEGRYQVQVRYSGFSPPLRIQFQEEEPARLPPVPTGLRVTELEAALDGDIRIRATWTPVQEVRVYRCELYRQGEGQPLVSYPDMKQTFCEFGGLRENTSYEVRVFSRNEAGYSSGYASAAIRTSDLPPPSPYGLGVVSALNHRVELVWSGVSAEDLVGYHLQVRPPGGRFLYYSREAGLTAERSAATLIEDRNDLVSILIDRDGEARPVLDNLVPYEFRVVAVDRGGNLSAPSSTLREVVLDDTVPPSPPHDIQYRFLSPDRVRISWKTRDRDIAKFRLYYGVEEDRLDGVVYTTQPSYDLIVDRERLKDRQLYVVVTAIDRAGNESGYRPADRSAEIRDREQVSQDIVFSADQMYRDYSVAIKQPPEAARREKKPEPRPKPRAPRTYGWGRLREKGFVVNAGETATLSGNILVPENVVIKVEDGGTLVLKGAVLEPSSGLWGGIRYQSGAGGAITDATIRSAAIGVGVVGNRNGLTFRDLVVERCAQQGILVKDSTLTLEVVTLRGNSTGLFIQNSSVAVTDSLFENNERGARAENFRNRFSACVFSKNSLYGIRLYGGGGIENSELSNNRIGMVVEKGRGAALIQGNHIHENLTDGLVVGADDCVLKGNRIAANGRHGIFVKDGANPDILNSDILNNRGYAVVGGGRVSGCHVAYNNGSIYVDDTRERGTPDRVPSSSSSGVIKQILNVDYIQELARSPVLR
jgi:parallel beta-helix repeat protein